MLITAIQIRRIENSGTKTGLMPDSRREGFPLFSYSIPKRFYIAGSFQTLL